LMISLICDRVHVKTVEFNTELKACTYWICCAL